MKKQMTKHWVPIFIVSLMFLALQSMGQAPTPPDLPGSHGSPNNHGPTGAPVDGGLTIFLILGACYGVKSFKGFDRKTDRL